MIDLIETYYMVEIRPIWPTFYYYDYYYYFFLEKIFVGLTFGIKVINKFAFFFFIYIYIYI